VFRPYCLSAGVSGNWFILLMRNRKPAILCSIGVTGVRVNICFSSCGFSLNLYLESIVDSKEQKIQGVAKYVSLKPRIEGYIGVYSFSLL
jgi:hypothetical protein